MAKTNSTIWAIEPHTEAKHDLLRNYFEAWLPIVGRYRKRVVYIDGFAGPGAYSGGQDGSPVVVLKVARGHAHVTCELLCIFIEADEPRHSHLSKTLAALSATLPAHIQYKVLKGSFTDKLPEALGFVTQQRERREPLFAFVDPFGMSHTPMVTIKEILRSSGSEVLINFMYEELNRFLSHDDLAANHDALFGTKNWRELLQLTDPQERKREIHDLYRAQLSQYAMYVRSFEMFNRNNRTDYFLFFATNSLLGLEKMKDAMWKVDDTGSYQFSDRVHTSGQLSFFSGQPQYDLLADMLLQTFGGKTVGIKQLEHWVTADTPFRRAHLKKGVLAPLEMAGRLKVINPSPKRHKGTFPDGTQMQISDAKS